MDRAFTRYEALIACRDKAGSISQLGRDLGIPQSTMSRIVNTSKQLPAEYVLLAEQLYDVPRELLRPDVYPHENSTPPANDISGEIPLCGPILSARALGKNGNRGPVLDSGKDAA